jgi:hypothetical protein
MLLHDLHIWLAILTTVVVLVATLEGAIRVVRDVPPGDFAFRTLVAVLLSVAVTALAGITLLITDHHPKEWLHLLYAALAFGLIPFADNAGTSLGSNRMRGLYRFSGGVICLLVLTRLFVTGAN